MHKRPIRTRAQVRAAHVKRFMQTWLMLSMVSASIFAWAWAAPNAFAKTLTLSSIEKADVLTPAPKHPLKNLILGGEGTLKYLFWNVYQARLHVTQSENPLQHYRSQPHALQLTYLRNIEAGTILKETKRQLTQQYKKGAQYALNKAETNALINNLKAFFPNIEKGQSILAHSNGQRIRFYSAHSGQEENDFEHIGTINNTPKTNNSAAFMNIWLHSSTSQPTLREALIKNLK